MGANTEFTSRNAFIDDWDVRLQRVDNVQKLVFDGLGPFDVRLLRMDASPKKDALLRPKDEIALEEYLLKTSEDGFRVLSFFQDFSLSPLMCSKNTVLDVIREWQVSSMFIDVLLKFGNQPRIFQESSGFRQFCQAKDASFELCYQFMYVELNGKRAPRDPWSFRQTGVYHRFSTANSNSQIILLHPNNEAVAQSKLETLAQSEHKADLMKHPLNIHVVIISAYLTNYQEHIESLADELEQIRRLIDVVDMTSSEASPIINPERLQTLRHIEDKIVCKACRCLRSTITLVQTMMTINAALVANNPSLTESSHDVLQELQLFEQRLQGHVNAAELLAERVQATLGLLTNLLDIGNQANSREISTRILGLTQEGVDDNATVKVITVFTLIYLPASFMASFLGMNLFDYNNSDGSLQASPQFWIFAVTTIPLTLITVGAWYMYKSRHDKRRKAREDLERG